MESGHAMMSWQPWGKLRSIPSIRFLIPKMAMTLISHRAAVSTNDSVPVIHPEWCLTQRKYSGVEAILNVIVLFHHGWRLLYLL